MASALPTCEGVFTRTHCTHPRLFEEEYKRSNRNRGTKILRCFPHCCPHHVDRSYCGSSLEGMLRFGSDSEFVDEDSLTAVPFDVAHVFVFARFETVDGSPLSRDAYSLHYLRSVSQSELNPEGSWIEGVRQTAADTQQHSQQMHGLQTSSRPSNSRPESATFVLNGQTYAKWYYHWESGANKVQRATKHVLKAYVFYKKQVDSVQTHHQQGSELAFNQDDLELLCVVSSPPFTVVSYRRAPLEAGVALPSSLGTLGLTAGASLMPHYATDTAHPVDSRLRRLVQHQISRAFQEYNHHQHHHHGGASDEPFEPFGASNLLDEQNDDQQGSDNRDPYGRYRHLQEREGLRYRLLTPEDAALSESPLHSQIPGREPRLIFDSTRRTDDRPLWRDPSEDGDVEFVADDFNEGDTRDEAAPQPPTRPSWVAQGALNNEVKASAPIGTTPSSTDPVRHIEQTANVTLLRFKLLQHQFDNQQRELQQLTDLAIIHYFVSGVTANSAQSLANLEVVFTIAITQNWRYASGGATHLARLLLSMAKDTLGGESHAATDSLTDAKREELVLVLAEVCVWAFSPESIELVQSLLAACHPILLDSLQPDSIEDEGKELRTGILNCVRRCWSALDAFLQTPRATRTMIRSVRELSDAVLGIVYSDPKLDELRSGLRTILQRPTIVLEDSKKNAAASLDAYGPVTPRCNLAGWSGFVAQIREGYLVRSLERVNDFNSSGILIDVCGVV